MIVDLIDTFEQLGRAAGEWEAVYRADPHARYFVSFRFLRDWLQSFDSHWFVLAAKPAPKSSYEAFLPLRLRTYARPDGRCVSEILMAGNYGADYTGLVALPDRARSAIPALARSLKLMHWSRLNLDYVPADDMRYRQLLAHFKEPGFRLDSEVRVNQRDNVNNLVCPTLELAPTWEGYLETLSANMRQKLRKLLRQVEADPSLSITQPTAATISADIEAMNALWLARWAERKGTERAHRILATNRQLLLDAFGRGDLFMPVLRKDGIMVAALATLVDPLKKAALFYMTGRDESFEGPAPGLLLHAHSIRSLIGEGFRTYDFLRGDEPYKLLFGPRMQHLQCLRIATRSGLNLGDRLESRAIRSALTLATVAHRKGRFRQAAAGYTQILATNPNDADALYRYAQLLDKVGQADHARLLLRRAAYARTRTRADG